MAEDWTEGGFGIYLHWPFCEAKCPYCDFNSYVSNSIDQNAWRAAYLAEIDRYADEFPDRIVNSVFFGGGTPSLMEPATVAAILDQITRRWRLSNEVEITLEANPSSVEARRFADYRAAGINRVSLGVQALDDNDLRKLGRLHSVDEAMRALEIARSAFDRASFDLIYARQHQTLKAWRDELMQALTMGFDHLSLYHLTIEDGTAFGDRHRRGKLAGLPDEDLSADMYDLTRDLCAKAGLQQYEVSNYAVQNDESRHNQIYWRYGDYIGIGPGAHGRLTDVTGDRWATDTPLAPTVWLKAAQEGLGQESRARLSTKDQGAEMMLMGLRMRDGVDVRRYKRVTGRELSRAGINELEEMGAIQISQNRIVVNDTHVGLLNSVIEKLLPD